MAKFMKTQCLQFLVIIQGVDIWIDINYLMNRGSVDVTLDFAHVLIGRIESYSMISLFLIMLFPLAAA